MTGAAQPVPGKRDLHLWLCSREVANGSDRFKRAVLSRYTGIFPDALRFAAGAHGKPQLVGIVRPLQFNLSHSGDLLVCAVTRTVPVGVDLELCDPDRVSLRVARRFFRAEESALLEGCDGARLVDRFYDLWTLKEAAVKARGEALAPGLSAHGFCLDYGKEGAQATGHVTVTTAATDDAHYLLLDPLAGYRAALCWMDVVPPRLSVYELHDGDRVMQLQVPLRAGSSCR